MQLLLTAAVPEPPETVKETVDNTLLIGIHKILKIMVYNNYYWSLVVCNHSNGPHVDAIGPALGRQSVLQQK